MAIENVLLRDDNGYPLATPVLLKTSIEDADGFSLGVSSTVREGIYNVFYSNKHSRGLSEYPSDFLSWAGSFAFCEGDQQVLAMQLRELADLLETM